MKENLRRVTINMKYGSPWGIWSFNEMIRLVGLDYGITLEGVEVAFMHIRYGVSKRFKTMWCGDYSLKRGLSRSILHRSGLGHFGTESFTALKWISLMDNGLYQKRYKTGIWIF